MYKLYYSPGLASMAPHMMLRALKLDHEIAFVDRSRGVHKSPEYLKLNPNGRIPTFVHGELVLFESAAICLHLADTHPDAHLSPPVGTPERAHFYKWLVFVTNTLQENLWHYYRPEFYVPADAQAAYRDVMDAHVAANLALMDTQIGSSPYVLGSDLSVVDFYFWMLGHWCRVLKAPPSTYPNVRRFMESMLTHSAVSDVIRIEELPRPLF